jgi:hypothetical protein
MDKSIFTMSFLVLSTLGLMAQNLKSSKNLKSKNMVKEVNSYVHFHGAPAKGKILMVASSPSKQTNRLANWLLGSRINTSFESFSRSRL